MKNFCTFTNPAGETRLGFNKTMKRALKNVILGSLLTVLLHESAGDLSAQGADAATGGEGVFKKLLINRFDTSLDGSLTGREKASAVDFLNRQDRDKDGQISLSERTAAIVELNKMPALGRSAAIEKMTPEDRNEAKRDVSWGDFLKKLPHSTEGRTFTKMPGDKGFTMKGDPYHDPTKVKGVAPGGDRLSSKELEERMAKLTSAHKLKQSQKSAKPLRKETKPAEVMGKRDYYSGTTIIVAGDEHTVVPEGAVISLPPKLAKMVAEKPKGALVNWPVFVKKHYHSIATREVSWETAKGEDPISEKDMKLLSIGGKLVVAVYKKNPISVMEPKPKKEVVEEVVDGAVAPDGQKKR